MKLLAGFSAHSLDILQSSLMFWTLLKTVSLLSHLINELKRCSQMSCMLLPNPDRRTKLCASFLDVQSARPEGLKGLSFTLRGISSKSTYHHIPKTLSDEPMNLCGLILDPLGPMCLTSPHRVLGLYTPVPISMKL